MHEVGLVAQLVDAAVEHAGSSPASLVRVRHATTIPEDVLRQAREMLVANGPLADAVLEAEPFDLRLRCTCGFDGALGVTTLSAPARPSARPAGSCGRFPVSPELELLEVSGGG